MESKLYFSFILTLVFTTVNCYSNIQQKHIQLTYEQGALIHSSLSRFRRQSPVSGYQNYMQGAAAQPSVVVIPSGIPPLYRGAGSSYGPRTSYGTQSYGAQGVSYGVNRPTVVVNIPDASSCTKKKKKKKKILTFYEKLDSASQMDDNYIAPAVNNPYGVSSSRL